jgi:hypothetical protein
MANKGLNRTPSAPVSFDVLHKKIMKEIISDPTFHTLGDETSLWKILYHEGVEINPSINDSVLSLNVSNTQGANWHGELRYAPFEVSPTEIYTVRFSVRAKHPFTFSVWLGQMNSPYDSLVPEENHFGEEMMTTEWQTFTHTWTPNLAESQARLNFVFGQIDNIVEIKDVSLTCKQNKPLDRTS